MSGTKKGPKRRLLGLCMSFLILISTFLLLTKILDINWLFGRAKKGCEQQKRMRRNKRGPLVRFLYPFYYFYYYQLLRLPTTPLTTNSYEHQSPTTAPVPRTPALRYKRRPTLPPTNLRSRVGKIASCCFERSKFLFLSFFIYIQLLFVLSTLLAYGGWTTGGGRTTGGV